MKKFPKVRPIGHPETDAITQADTVHVLEKMDGANFRFTRDGDRILFGSRNVIWKNEKDIANAFEHAVEFVRGRVNPEDLEGEVTYFGEAMHPHTLEYDWDNVPSVLGFGIYDESLDEWVEWPNARDEFEAVLGLPTVPEVTELSGGDLDGEYDIPESEYRDGGAEGIVFWDHDGNMAKLRSEEFREKHDGKTSGPENHTPSDGHEILVDRYCTEMRINKRIDDLLDEGHDLSRGLMGEGLPQAVSRDIFEEEAYEIVGMNETVDLKAYRSLVAKRCLDRIDERLRERAGSDVEEATA